MANLLYDEFKEKLLGGNVDLDATSTDVRIILIDVADYTVNGAVHDYLNDIPAAARVAVSGAVSNKTVVDGTFDFDNPTISNVTGDTVEAVVAYIHTGNEATSLLIAYIDKESDGSTPISFTPNGSDVEVQFPNGLFSI